MEGDWSNLSSIIFKADQSDFLLPAGPASNRLRFPVGVRCDTRHASLSCDEGQRRLAKLLLKPPRS